VVAVAVNCTVLPCVVLEFVGIRAIAVMFPSEIVTVVEPLIVPEAAAMVAVPTDTPVTSPVLLMLATVESEVDQKALLVRSLVEPSL
jgi:hypothetical protein